MTKETILIVRVTNRMNSVIYTHRSHNTVRAVKTRRQTCWVDGYDGADKESIQNFCT